MYAHNLSGLGTVGPAGKKPIDVRDIYPDTIEVGDRQRPLDQKKVEELARSMQEHGQKQPIGVRRKGKLEAGYLLIYGLHRLEAIKLLVREGDEHAHIWAVVYDVDYPEILMQMDELVENLHRNELTPAERASHQLTYAGLLKKADKVSALKNKRADNAKKQHSNKSAEPQLAAMHSKNGKPTITEKLAADSGVDKDTIHRRHATGQKLAARLDVSVPSLEKATAEELIEGGKAALLAAQDKIEKAKQSGKAEAHVDPVKPQKPTSTHVDLDVVDLPKKFIGWCRRAVDYEDHPLSIETLEETHKQLGEFIAELREGMGGK